MAIIDILPGLRSLWQETRGSPGIHIAILDGPVDMSHPCFQGAGLSRLRTLVPGEPGQNSATLHGTGVASIIFGRQGSIVEGIAPGCSGIILPIFRNRKNGGIFPGSQLDLARAITQAVDAGAHIINISGGESDLSGQAEHFLARAVNYCVEKGVLIVSAVGNDGCACLHVPAALSPVLAVGAMDARGKPMGFSNWGEKYRQNGILAPGENIPTAVPGGGSVLKSGTSFAAPIVSGIAGLLLSLQAKQGRKPDPYAVREALLKSAVPCNPAEEKSCQRFLVGKLDIAGAVKRITAGGTGKTFGMSGTRFADKGNPFPSFRFKTPGLKASGLKILCPCTGDYIPPPSSRVYAVGTVGCDFGSEARRDSIRQNMKTGLDLYNTKHLLEHLREKPRDAGAVTWTLNMRGIPVYAIIPRGPFAHEGYRLLPDYLEALENGKIERISLPGIITAQTRLMSGQVVPVVTPDLRGMCGWSTDALVKTVLEAAPGTGTQVKESIRNFLERVYYELENLGLSPEHRAINFAAARAFNASRIFADAVNKSLNLASIEVEKSAICRPGSDCREVLLRFFDPRHKTERAVQVYRFTVDVRHALPVILGEIRSWNEY